MRFFNNRILGIDFGTRFVKIVELEKSGKNINLTNYSITSLLWEDSLNYPLGATQLFEENLAIILREGTKGSKTKNAAFVLPSPFLFSKFFTLPVMPEKSFKNVIDFEARKYLPVDSGEISVQSRIFQLQDSFQEDKIKPSVFLVGIPNGLAHKLQTAANLASLHYKLAEPEFFVYEPFFKGSSGNFIFINLDLNYTVLFLFHNGQFVFAKKLQSKFLHLIENISKLLEVSLGKSEEFLIDKKFNIPDEIQNIKDAVSSFFNSACNEIQSEIDGIKYNFGFKIENVFIGGSILEMPGFLETFQKNCDKLKIDALDSFKKLKNVPNQSNVLSKSPVFGGAIGVCLKYFFK